MTEEAKQNSKLQQVIDDINNLPHGHQLELIDEFRELLIDAGLDYTEDVELDAYNEGYDEGYDEGYQTKESELMYEPEIQNVISLADKMKIEHFSKIMDKFSVEQVYQM